MSAWVLGSCLLALLVLLPAGAEPHGHEEEMAREALGVIELEEAMDPEVGSGERSGVAVSYYYYHYIVISNVY